MTALNKAKWALFIVCMLVLLIIVFQNLTATEVHLLFGTLSTSLAALLAMTLLIGFCMGLFASTLWKTLWKVRSWRAQAKAAKDKNSHNRELV